MLTPGQMKEFQQAMGVPEGHEWDPFVGLDVSAIVLRSFLDAVPFARTEPRVRAAAPAEVPAHLDVLQDRVVSTQAGFGRVLSELGSGNTALAQRIVTISPDVTLSTNLGGWVNRRGIFHRSERRDAFRDLNVPSPQRWAMSPSGQHFELGIAEHNLFIMLAALGLSAPLFGARLLPIGTVYDPFVLRGLDAFGYACYQDARFMVVGTPAGISLAPEGGAHQSVATPLVGMAMDRCTAFEPAYVDELVEIMLWGFRHLQAEDGGSVYLRLTTRALSQPEREMTPALRDGILDGAYWIREPAPGADLALVYCGPVATEAAAAHQTILEDIPDAGLLAVTSPDRLYADWRSGTPTSHIDRLLMPLAHDAALVTVLDGHPAALSWLGAVRGHRTYALGVDHFGQSADVVDLYRVHGIDEDAILDAIARACVERHPRL
jgi:pyruvate dehydrogenase E1 component